MKLYKHQQNIVDKKPKITALVWETGTGKSLAGIMLANTAQSVLVICPKGLLVKWQRDMAQLCTKPFLVLTKEQFKKHYASIGRYDCIVVDEAHHFLGMTSQLYKTLHQYIQHYKIDRRYFLTATPYRSSPWDVFCLLRLLGDTTYTYIGFRKQFFNQVKMGMRTVFLPKKDAKELLLPVIKNVASVVRLDECVDVPLQLYKTIKVSATKEQKKAIDEMDEFMPLPRFTKEHQIIGGYNPDTDMFVKTEKTDVLVDLLDNDYQKVVVVCKYRREMDMLEKLINEKLHIQTYQINGDMTPKERQDTLSRLTGDQYCLIVNADTVEGWECPSAQAMVFYSYSWKLVSYVQALGRIQRINNVKHNAYISLVCQGTVDEAVYDCIMSKSDFHADIYTKEQGRSKKNN